MRWSGRGKQKTPPPQKLRIHTTLHWQPGHDLSAGLGVFCVHLKRRKKGEQWEEVLNIF